MSTNPSIVFQKIDSGIPQKAVVHLECLFFAFIFLLVRLNLFTKEEIAAAAAQGIPFASVAVPLAGAIALVLITQFGAGPFSLDSRRNG
jgi:hypothetical protein